MVNQGCICQLRCYLASFVFISFINSEFDIIYYTKLKHRCVLLSGRSGPTSKEESTSVTKKTNTHVHPDKKIESYVIYCVFSHILLCIVFFLKIAQTYYNAYAQKFFIK